MQTIVYHSKARKTMCGMGTFCLIGMISFQLTMQNGEMLSMGEYPLKYGNEVIDIDTIPDGANWYITNDSTQNKPLGWTATRIIIVSFVVSNYKIQFAGEAINGKFAVRVSPGGWVEI